MLHSICQQIWKTQQRPQDWKRSVFIPIPKKGNAKECSNHCTVALITHASKECSKFSKPGFNSMWTMKFQMFQAGFRKGRGTRDQIANVHWIIKKSRSVHKNFYFCFINYTKPWTVWITIHYGKFSEMGISDHLTCLLRKSVCRSRSNS